MRTIGQKIRAMARRLSRVSTCAERDSLQARLNNQLRHVAELGLTAEQLDTQPMPHHVPHFMSDSDESRGSGPDRYPPVYYRHGKPYDVG